MSLMNIRPGNITEFSGVDAIKECVMLGMGLGLLPEIVVAEELGRKELSTLRWAGPEMDIATHVVWHKDKWISPALRVFLSVLQEMVGEGAGHAGRPRSSAVRTPRYDEHYAK